MLLKCRLDDCYIGDLQLLHYHLVQHYHYLSNDAKELAFEISMFLSLLIQDKLYSICQVLSMSSYDEHS